MKIVYITINSLIIALSLFGILALFTPVAEAQSAGHITTPEDISASLISWLKTGMTVVFLLTLLFGAHNMWLHNKFTSFKEQTIEVIRAEFKPQLADIERNMATRETLENWKQLQEILLRSVLEKVDINTRITLESKQELTKATETLKETKQTLNETKYQVDAIKNEGH